MRWLDALCARFLRWRGHKVNDDVGVTLIGNCVAVGTEYDMRVRNPSGKIHVGWGSSFMFLGGDNRRPQGLR